MTPQSKTPGAGDAEGSEIGSLNTCQNTLDALRAQYLSEIFSLPPDTACLLAELAFGEASQ